MSTILRLIKWSWRAWPVIILLILLFFHLSLIHYFCLNAGTTNKSIALISQITGGLLVLYSIDSNIGVLKGKSLFEMFTNYLREFPLTRRSVVIEAQAGSYGISGAKARPKVARKPKSIEEQLEYLQEQINEVRRDFEQETKELNQKIDAYSKEMNTKIETTQTVLRTIESKMDEVSIGGIKVQLFGVLLLIYGSISDYVA
jgi:hypothetical protein